MHALAAVLVQTSLSNQVFHVVIKRLEVSVDHCDAHTLLMLLSLFGNRRLLRTKEIISIRVRFLDLATDPCIPKVPRPVLGSDKLAPSLPLLPCLCTCTWCLPILILLILPGVLFVYP